MVAAYFGFAHFYGIPYGVIGVVLAWFLGWILARSMPETRGLSWAWFIHFVQDVAIFGFMSIGAIIPGAAEQHSGHGSRSPRHHPSSGQVATALLASSVAD